MSDDGNQVQTLGALTARFTRPGEVRWIGVRPGRRIEMTGLTDIEIGFDGLKGDRRSRPGKRAVSLIQFEHLAVIAALLGREELPPALIRRNIVVAGINLLGLRKRRFRAGHVLLEGTGVCAPCSRMEEALGFGGYSAARGHGGITAEVLEPGPLRVGDPVSAVDENSAGIA